MKFFIDTANVEDIRKANDMGGICGVTTNPSLIAKEGRDFNQVVKEIADIVGIDKNLTHHLARRTFATTVLLYNDVPMEIVSELLGHATVNITLNLYVHPQMSQKKKCINLVCKNFQEKILK